MNDESLKKLFEDLFGDEDGDKTEVHRVRVIRVKSKDEDTQEEPKKEPTKEPSPEKASEKVAAAMILANIRFVKAMKDATSEFYQLSRLANEILKENHELRTRLGEKR